MPAATADNPTTPTLMPHGQGDAQGATERPLAEFRALSRAQQQKRVIQEFSELQHLDQVPNDAIDTMFLTALTPAHRDKNRYCDVLANEATIYPPPSTDLYINGNLIRGERFGTTFQNSSRQGGSSLTRTGRRKSARRSGSGDRP